MKRYLKNVRILWLLLALLDYTEAQGQAASVAAPLVIGQTFTLHSQVLGETRRLNVYLPAGYAESATQRLPVLYMPDGGLEEDFLHVTGLLQVLVADGSMRPFILVGIENTARRRDLTGPTTVASDLKIAPRVGGSAAFRQFIRQELMPEIQRRYRTTPETAIVGESLAGLFVVETLLLEPTLFTTYLAFDPSLWWNNGQLASRAPALLQGYAGAPRRAYLATSSQGDTAATRQLSATLNQAAVRGLSGRYRAMPEETHQTVYHPAALWAFRLAFKP
ncbi:MAG: alpha/beta hydrolase [Cytophagaceae bacterium]|nr:MAG: alpha/beta hydrolase [Cytophagaceae bacterium]